MRVLSSILRPSRLKVLALSAVLLVTGAASTAPTTENPSATSAFECQEFTITIGQWLSGRFDPNCFTPTGSAASYFLTTTSETSIRIHVYSAAPVKVSLFRNNAQTTRDYSETRGGDALTYAEVYGTSLKPGRHKISVMSIGTSSAPYSVKVFGSGTHLHGSCWIGLAQAAAPNQQRYAPAPKCKFESQEAFLEYLDLSRETDVEVIAPAGAKVRYLGTEGITTVWADSKDGQQARFGRTLSPGRHYFTLARSSLSGMPYSIMTYTPGRNDHPSTKAGCNNPALLPEARPGTTYYSRIDENSCHRIGDYTDGNHYWLRVTTPQEYIFSMRTRTFTPSIEIERDSSEADVAVVTAPHGQKQVELRRTLQPGLYLVRAMQASGSADGSFELTVSSPAATVTATAPPSTPAAATSAGTSTSTTTPATGASTAATNNRPLCTVSGTRETLQLGEVRRGRLETSSCRFKNSNAIYYRLDVPGARSVTLELSGTGMTPVLTLFDASGAQIGEHYDAGGKGARLVMTLFAGTYYVAARGYGTVVAGEYSLSAK